ncbi:polysaccharide deacetylase family protein [Pseudovibrio ascidiaceicola]|uniref:polysaccharide deacetylase family protein n=1 Tax=Pseudovibrio ascidiaceicola TaxID=285279 RepID=UPI001AD8DA4C|nr:polysaccharide deacetylase family protein [Pseudovibrio ascidiaceicola]
MAWKRRWITRSELSGKGTFLVISSSAPVIVSVPGTGYFASNDQEAFEQHLSQHLNWFEERGLTVKFWWRDDDAVSPTPALEELLAFSGRFGIPLSLAVIPKFATEALAQRLVTTQEVHIVHHGWQHKNYQMKSYGEKASEFGWRRTSKEMAKELAEGRVILQSLFGKDFVPLFVPPWNRIAPRAVQLLKQQGDYGLSAFTWINHFRLPRLQSHIDIIKWKKNKRFIGWDAAQKRLDLQLCRRRTNTSEPIGLLTHHLDHGEGCSEFLEVFFKLTSAHPAVKWLSSQDLLDEAKHDFTLATGQV